MRKIKGILIFGACVLIIAMLFYTRISGIDWGLPYSMHPDERNMVTAVQQLNCEISILKFQISNCFNPQFFAYGQFPLYLGYVIVFLLKFIDGDLGTAVSSEEATLALRLISAVASILNVFILLKLVNLLISNIKFSNVNNFLNLKKIDLNFNLKFKIYILLIFIFSPFFIQFSHFGTTESLLMFLYTVIVYLSLKYSFNQLDSATYYLLTAIVAGVAIGTKTSSVLFLIAPLALVGDKSDQSIFRKVMTVSYLLSLTLIFTIIFSPHNFISFLQFLGAMKYESDVALGSYRAFYTRQFEGVSPVVFQFFKIFPYSLGWPVFLFSLLGFLFLPYKKEFNFLRLTVLAGFLPNAFMYAKWTRFIAPILPLMLVFAVVFAEFLILNFQFLFNFKFLKFISDRLNRDRISNYLRLMLVVVMIVPGMAYFSIYQKPDVRFTVSDWINKNIPENSYILSETANVVDVPITNPKIQISGSMKQSSNFNYISFNFYDLDENPDLPSQLEMHLAEADYIFIPSRRIFANNYCPEENVQPIAESELNFKLISKKEIERCQYVRVKYPKLNQYYDKLFSGELGFSKVAEFSEFPKIRLFGKTIIELPDEEAEETWTVFDHPVFRIYKRT